MRSKSLFFRLLFEVFCTFLWEKKTLAILQKFFWITPTLVVPWLVQCFFCIRLVEGRFLRLGFCVAFVFVLGSVGFELLALLPGGGVFLVPSCAFSLIFCSLRDRFFASLSG
jgi:hypothetical protein